MARCFCGILILTVYQMALVAPRLPTEPSAPLQISRDLPYVSFWLSFVALWSDFHFYMVHRLIHVVPVLYSHVHKVHHYARNPDPWSGMSMHPLEHALFFSAMLLCLVVP